MPQPNNRIRDLINEAIHLAQVAGKADSKQRRYLGGSQLGRPCDRELWYSFHWALYGDKLDPRVLRIFDRGHREEERMVAWLRLIGCDVQEYDPDTVPTLWHHPESDSYFVTLGSERVSDTTAMQCNDVTGTVHEFVARSQGVEIPEPRQFSWVSIDGHHKGNLDGRARHVPGQIGHGVAWDDWLLLEFKTHNTKSFVNLQNEGVYKAKRDHWVQMQRYMEKRDMRLALYGAANKNDDDLYFEFVARDDTQAHVLDMRARVAIYSTQPPRRISNSASWHECKWCDFKRICHYGEPMAKNCRTCVDSVPVTDGNWHCNRWNRTIPHAAEKDGCAMWKQRTD